MKGVTIFYPQLPNRILREFKKQKQLEDEGGPERETQAERLARLIAEHRLPPSSKPTGRTIPRRSHTPNLKRAPAWL
jgi:hypothetical protein